MNKLRYTMFIVTVFVVLTLSAIITVPALADDSTPPPTETPIVEAPPTEAVAPLVEETVPAVETTLQNGTVADILASVPERTDIVVVNADGETVPLASKEATDIINSNDPIWCPTGVSPNPGVDGCTSTQASFNGGLIPLLNNKKANGTIWILGDYQGTIVLEGGAVILDAGSLGTTASYTLTVQGGWTGATSGTIDSNNPSEFNVPFRILAWNNTITLSDIEVTGVNTVSYTSAMDISSYKNITVNNVNVHDNSTIWYGAQFNTRVGTGGNIVVNDSSFNNNGGTEGGLYVGSSGAITVKNLTANSNESYGAYLDTRFSTSSGVIIVDGSNNFNFNHGEGLKVEGKSAITLNNTTATSNGGNGGNLNNPGNNNPGSIVVNNSTFNNNSLTGLYVITNKNITLNNVDAVGNGNRGANLDNIGLTGAPGTILINDSTFNNNGSDGLSINSRGTITIKNLSSNNNIGTGTTIHVSDLPSPITFIGSNNFKFNGSHGLYIFTIGSVALNNVTAIYNVGGSGVEVDNCFYNAPSGWCNNPTSAVVTIKGASNFSNNGWDGLRVWSSGAITLGNITANNNGTDAARPGATFVNPDGIPSNGDEYYLPDAYGKGVFLHNFGSWSSKAITLTGTNIFNGNASTGLYVESWGKVTANNLTANNNGCDTLKESSSMCDGANLIGDGVTLTGYGVFNGNYDDGLFASSYGAVTLNNLDAENNGWWGVGIDSYGPAAVVSVLGTNTFINNLDSGLNIWSQGAVTLNNITANDNHVDGVYVDSCEYDNYSDPSPLNWHCRVTTSKPVTLNGINIFNGNLGTGFNVFSNGVITTNNITALLNGNGVSLDNCIYEADPLVDDCKALPGKAVTMNGNNNINNNTGNGLYIQSLGAIKVNNVTASNNGWLGVTLDNNWTKAVGTVTITGFLNASNNGYKGLGIYSHGAITTSNLTINGNAQRGAIIYNAFDPTKSMGVTLLGNNLFNDNWNTGLEINSNGTVVLNTITAISNGEPYDATLNPTPWGLGVKIDNSGAATAKSVTLNGVNIFNGNLEDGLSLTSKGVITIKQLTVNNNGGRGAYIDNQWGVTNSNITFSGAGVFNGNGSIGLEVYSNGNIVTNSLTANYNLGGLTSLNSLATGGAYLDNWSTTTAPVTVTLLGVNNFVGNGTGDGLIIFSDGAITLNSITANDNNGDGAYLNNTDYQKPLKVGNITLNGTNTFVNNALNGLEFYATGNVTMTRVNADWNDGNTLDANLYAGVFGTAGGTITLTCGSMNFNTAGGYDLTAGIGKLVTLKGVFTYSNGLGDFSSAPTVSTRTCPLP